MDARAGRADQHTHHHGNTSHGHQEKKALGGGGGAAVNTEPGTRLRSHAPLGHSGRHSCFQQNSKLVPVLQIPHGAPSRAPTTSERGNP